MSSDKTRAIAARGINMRRTRRIAVLLGVVAVTFVATDASAYFHPGMGRFIQRDPGGGDGVRIGAGAPAPAAGFAPRDPYPDGMNLYQYVRSSPVTRLDPFGLQAVKGGDYGDWDIDQRNTDGRPTSWRYRSSVKIKFFPNKNKVCCDEIAFIQMGRCVDNKGAPVAAPAPDRATREGRSIDRQPGFKSPYYGYLDDGTPGLTMTAGRAPEPYREAEMDDTPSSTIPGVSWEFETVSVCKEGKDIKKVYGSLTWGFRADKSSKVTSHNPKASGYNSRGFRSALFMWNMQALGPAKQRNHPNQEIIDVNYWNRSIFARDPVEVSVSREKWEETGKLYWAAQEKDRPGMDALIP